MTTAADLLARTVKPNNEPRPPDPDPTARAWARPNDRRLQDQLDDGCDHLERIDRELPQILRRIRDAQEGQPGGQTYDALGPSGTATRRWCFTHEAEPTVECAGPWCLTHDRVPLFYSAEPEVVCCDRDCRMSPDACDVQAIPSRSDPTGEAAAEQDRARDDEAKLLKLLAHVCRSLDQATEVADRYTARAATSLERRLVAAENDHEPGCQLCAKIDRGDGEGPTWVPAHTKNPTTCAGNLKQPGWFCLWHWEYIIAVGEAPPLKDTRLHLAGKTVMRPAHKVEAQRRKLKAKAAAEKEAAAEAAKDKTGKRRKGKAA